MHGLHWFTVNDLLQQMLKKAMSAKAFDKFVLVGGTALSLQLGHRASVDIDLFTDAKYESIDFESIDNFFRQNYQYVKTNKGQIGLGTSYYAGNNDKDAVKIDIYYTDAFIRPFKKIDDIRLASVEDIIAMKLDIVSHGGRKKDFWDLHELTDHFSVDEMIGFHNARYPYSHDDNAIRDMLTDFSLADDDFNPECLKGKHWELIKLDFVNLLK